MAATAEIAFSSVQIVYHSRSYMMLLFFFIRLYVVHQLVKRIDSEL